MSSDPADRTGPSRTGIRVRRIVSLVLSITSGLASIAVLITFIAGPSFILVDGTHGLPPLLAFLVEHFGFVIAAAIAAVILAGSMPRAARIDHRLPLPLAIIVSCLATATILFPLLSAALSLVVGLILT